MAENGRKWPKMAENGRKMSRKWLKMAGKWPEKWLKMTKKIAPKFPNNGRNMGCQEKRQLFFADHNIDP
jgi:hypothetical protein